MSARLRGRGHVHGGDRAKRPGYVPRVTALPTWAIFTISFGSPILAFLGAFLGHMLTRQSARELEERSRREETMRTLRWAADLAVKGDPASAAVGMKTLEARGLPHVATRPADVH